MKIPFNTPARKWLAAAFAAVLALLYVGLAARQFVASWLGSRVELKSLTRAAWLDPGNAEYRNHLGRYYDLVARDPDSAVGQYRAAVQLNPHSARYWFDLASAYQVLGDTTNQTAALERAIQADSTTPDVAWEAANLYLVQGENDKALREFRVVLANDATLAGAAIQLCWRIQPDADRLLRDVVPPTGSAYIAFLTLLENDAVRLLRQASSLAADAETASRMQVHDQVSQVESETAATFKVWDALIQSRQPFEERQVYDYLRFLILRKEVDQAVLVWQQSADRFGLSAYLSSPANLIVNSQLSLPLLNAGFDWQYQKQHGVNLTLQPLNPKDPHSPRSLMITFDGPGIHDAGIYQYVPVEPNTTYEFSAHYRNGAELEGAGGPHFTVQDMYSQVVYYESDVLKATDEVQPSDDVKDLQSRKSVDGEFTTSSDCKLVVVHIRRLPEGSPIRGKLWVDDFRLMKKPS